MFQRIRDLSAALHSLVEPIQQLSQRLTAAFDRPSGDDDLRERVEGLELSRSMWEAETEATFLKADSKLKAARNAEERTRNMERRIGESSDEGDVEGAAEIQAALEQYRVLNGDVEGGAEEGMQPVHSAVGPGRKATALRAKFG